MKWSKKIIASLSFLGKTHFACILYMVRLNSDLMKKFKSQKKLLVICSNSLLFEYDMILNFTENDSD